MTEMVYGAVPRHEGEPVISRWWRTVDRWSMSCVLILFGIGILLGLAASPPLAERNGLEPFHYVQRQAVFGCAALIVMCALSAVTPVAARRFAALGFLAAFAALLMLPVFGSDFGQGAVRWYSLGVASIQPSEFLKPVFVVVSAWLMAAGKEINGPPGRTWSLLLALVIVGFLAMQPDFGQASLVLLAWGVVYFVAGAPILLLLLLAVCVAAAGALAYSASEHFAGRIDAFLEKDLVPNSQLGFATEAIREGGLFGVGLGEGRVKWNLPDAHTDFIIAVAAEEYGVVLSVGIVMLYGIIVVRSLLRLTRERDACARLAGTGLAVMFGVQAMIHIGVTVRLLPAKGMTLPFVSYGGSSLIAGGIAMGLLLAFTRTRPQGEIGDVLRGLSR